MAITENIVKGKKYRVCIDADKNEWDRVSMWTAASDVELESGDSVETALNSLNENLTADDNLQFKFGKDGDGNYGYYGADGSLIPFKSGGELGFVASQQTMSTSQINLPSNYTNEKFFSYSNGSFTVLKKCKANFVLATGGSRVCGYVYLYINDTIKAQILEKLDVITYSTELNIGDKINCYGKTANGDFGSYPLVSCSV